MSNPSIKKGNICITEKGQLFLAMGPYRVAGAIKGVQSWGGIGFNGQMVYAVTTSFVANTINEYLQQTYGTSYETELASAVAQTSPTPIVAATPTTTTTPPVVAASA